MADEMRKGMGGLGKMNASPKGEKKAPKVDGESKPDEHGEHRDTSGGEKTSTITHHADGTHSMDHDGEHTDHPHHMHLMAHLGHKLTGGDAHHVTHHDGMEGHSHFVDEAGQHQDHEGDPHESLNAMMGGGMSDQGAEGGVGGEQMDQVPQHQTYGGM
jgi:hypothetical protein